MALVIGLDADDTLWESERLFQETEAAYREIVAGYQPTVDLAAHLLDIERANLLIFGYGAKSMTLSMIEAAIDATDGAITSSDIGRIVALGKELANHAVEVFPGVVDAVASLADRYRLMLITKGDLLHQERKVEASGLAPYFFTIEIVSEKDPRSYQAVLDQHDIAPADFVMVGNSVKSDVLPVLEIGARGVHVPHDLLWAAEHVHPIEEVSVPTIESLAHLASLLEAWEREAAG
ncbi:MAG: HAD family hydrolase [Acidimicrobiales bacterium]|nr:HAD family hydrolase [Acidimicrobiales bacterium]